MKKEITKFGASVISNEVQKGKHENLLLENKMPSAKYEFYALSGKKKFCQNVREFYKLRSLIFMLISCLIYEIFGFDIVREI